MSDYDIKGGLIQWKQIQPYEVIKLAVFEVSTGANWLCYAGNETDAKRIAKLLKNETETQRLEERVDKLSSLLEMASAALETCDHHHGNSPANDTWWFDWEKVEAAKQAINKP